jgi:hypothetical protein
MDGPTLIRLGGVTELTTAVPAIVAAVPNAGAGGPPAQHSATAGLYALAPSVRTGGTRGQCATRAGEPDCPSAESL